MEKYIEGTKEAHKILMDNVRQEMRTFWNRDIQKYDEKPDHGIHDESKKNQWRDAFQGHRSGTKILDVGTGTGFVALLAAEKGFDVTGIDWSETMLAQAKKKATAQKLARNFTQGATEELPFADNSFDLLTARYVIWTLADPVAVFKEWFRVLKIGGKVYADYTPPAQEREHMGHHYSATTEDVLPLNRHIPIQTIEEMFRTVGFKQVFGSVLNHEGVTVDGGHTRVYMLEGTK